MTQPGTETVTLSLASCEACDQVFLVSPRRETCPTCGGGPGLVLFEWTGSASGIALKTSLPDNYAGAAEPVRPPGTPPAPGAPEEELVSRPPAPEAPSPTPAGPAVEPPPPPGGTVQTYLRRLDNLFGLTHEVLKSDPPDWTPLRTAIADLGAEEEESTAAINYLEAVRGFFHYLAAHGLGNVAPAPTNPNGDEEEEEEEGEEEERT